MTTVGDVGTGMVPADRHADLQAWVDATWDPDAALVEWRSRLIDAGWGCPAWPTAQGGLGLPAAAAQSVTSALAELGVPALGEGVGMSLAAPTLLAHGGDALCHRLLRPTGTGEIVWCQLFSEPGAGSDLAGLTTRAERDGDEWVVSGQKVWTTGAHQAHLGLLLARTDWDAPKHRGITYFVLPMDQPGVEVRPLRQMNGYASFNEVFLDEARIPAANVVGEVGGGWAAARTTLAHERRLAPSPPSPRRRDPQGRVWREALAERTAASEPHKWYPQRAGRADLVIERARARHLGGDPVARQEIAGLLGRARSAGWTARRAAATRAQGRPGPEGSLGKLASSNIARQASGVHSHLAGPAGMLAGSDAPLNGLITEIFVSVPAISIAGGTDEIQHNIIGERVLGLPREPDNRDLPFRTIPRSAPRP